MCLHYNVLLSFTFMFFSFLIHCLIPSNTVLCEKECKGIKKKNNNKRNKKNCHVTLFSSLAVAVLNIKTFKNTKVQLLDRYIAAWFRGSTSRGDARKRNVRQRERRRQLLNVQSSDNEDESFE